LLGKRQQICGTPTRLISSTTMCQPSLKTEACMYTGAAF